MTISIFIEAVDVLLFRGNRLFGDPGSFGETMRLPWPSAAAGAIRSALLVRKGVPLKARGGWDGEDEELGTPKKPGTFTLTGWQPARRDMNGQIERFYPVPGDLVIAKEENGEKETLHVRPLRPVRLASGLASSYGLPMHPVLAERSRSKPESGFWLTQSGWQRYLDGRDLTAEHLVPNADLWQIDLRVGVGLDVDKRAAAEGRLFTVQALAPRMHWIDTDSTRFDVGYVADVAGATIAEPLTLRLGGDGRAAVAHPVEARAIHADYRIIVRDRRCRLVLTTPGIFGFPPHDGSEAGGEGWLPQGAQPENRREDGAVRFELLGVTGWIVAAVVQRFEVVSGWDLAQWQPKPALRAAPVGSVYWLELDEGVTAEALSKLVERGLWTDEQYDNEPRRAEGFNRAALAAWS